MLAGDSESERARQWAGERARGGVCEREKSKGKKDRNPKKRHVIDGHRRDGGSHSHTLMHGALLHPTLLPLCLIRHLSSTLSTPKYTETIPYYTLPQCTTP